jgi:ABC-type oligopeptide transport system, periplasmic component
MKFVCKSILLLFTVVVFAACGNKNQDDENLSIFKYNESAGILTLDPIYAKDLPHIWACNQLYNSLVAFDDSMNVIPALAEQWDISDDGLIYTFRLKKTSFFMKTKSLTAHVT